MKTLIQIIVLVGVLFVLVVPSSLSAAGPSLVIVQGRGNDFACRPARETRRGHFRCILV